MIILDLDGVCADFSNAACVVHGRYDFEPTRWNFFDEWTVRNTHGPHYTGFHAMTPAEFWKPIHDLGDEFYEDIVQPYPWLEELIRMVEDTEDFVVMSSPSNSPAGYAGKKIWCDKHLGKVKLIVGSEKHLLSKPGHVLIDDYDVNLRNFTSVEDPGHAITFPQLWNTKRFHAGNSDARLSYLRTQLHFWRNLKYATNA